MRPFGLQNQNASCHLIAVLQMLFSCDIMFDLMERIEEVETYIERNEVIETNFIIDDKYTREQLTAAILKLTKYIVDTLTIAQQLPIKDIHRTAIPHMPSYIINTLSVTNIPRLRALSQQQSACETFDIMVDLLGLSEAFKITYKHELICPQCNHSRIADEDLDVFHYGVSETTNLRDDIRYFNRMIECDCGKCSSKKMESHYLLKTLSDNIVVLFNKYDTKKNFNHPEYLEFITMDDTKITYELTAQIEHKGTMNNGHYTAIVARDDEFYLCDDSSITPLPEIKSTPHTYMALWTLVHEDGDIRRQKELFGKKYKLLEYNKYAFR